MIEKGSTIGKLDECLTKIETQLDWGSSTTWNTDDFERLSSLIKEKTDVLLSVTTLKRIWGKIKYDSSPNIKTLDALTQYAGLGTWRSFNESSNPTNKRSKVYPGTSILEMNWRYRLALLLLGILSVCFFTRSSFFSKQSQDPTDYAFESRVVSTGLPNSVVFEYDASTAEEDDIIELQQSWDHTKRKVLDRNKRITTSIYYTPGYFKSKLVVNNKIMKEHDVFIPTDGWLGTIEGDAEPIYLNKEEIINGDGVSISLTSITNQEIDPRRNETWTNLYNVGDWGDISVDDFTMKTKFRNDYNDGINSCQFVEIVLYCAGEVVLARYSIPGCVAKNRIFVLEESIDGSTEDLSSFGVDYKDWVDIMWVGKDDMLSFYIDDQLTYQTKLSGKTNKINGIKYHFQGAGSVNTLQLQSSEGVNTIDLIPK